MSTERFIAVCWTIAFVAVCGVMVSCQWSLVAKAKIEAHQEPRP